MQSLITDKKRIILRNNNNNNNNKNTGKFVRMAFLAFGTSKLESKSVPGQGLAMPQILPYRGIH